MNLSTAREAVRATVPPAAARETLWQRLVRGTRRLRQRADWVEFVGADWPDRIMELPVTDDYHAKQGRSTGRLVLEENGRRLAVYLKRHFELPWWQGWLAWLRPNRGWSPALRERRHLEWAQARGLPVPKVVAAGEFIGPWWRLQSFLVIEELTNMLPLHQAIPAAARHLDPATFRRWKAGLIAEMARLTRELHRRRWYHKDLYLCHFFIPYADTRQIPEWRGRVHLIDLHRLGHHGWTWRWWWLKDLSQLLFSSEIEGVDARDRLLFWRLYQGERRSRWLARCIRFKARLYRRHNAKESP
jgi:heptose I phosphotransferase